MAETLISPGVLALENDQSFITQQPVTVGAALIGPTVKGPVEIPTIVTSYSDYQNKFGTTFLSASQVYTYFTSIAAFNYFNNGGETLLVSRVVSGSFISAFTSASATSNPTPNGCGILNANNSESVVLKTISEGKLMNSSCSLDASGSLTASGSADNIRWQIANRDTANGTFSLFIRHIISVSGHLKVFLFLYSFQTFEGLSLSLFTCLKKRPKTYWLSSKIVTRCISCHKNFV